MGLDMYLHATKYFSSFSEADTRDKLEKVIGRKFQSCEVKVEVGYWRKANQIHKWFVDTCGKELDDDNNCDMEVSREQLAELKALCEQIIEILDKQLLEKVKKYDKWNKKDYEHEVYTDTKEVEKLLPRSQGFFFGDYEYDEYYKADLEQTITIINKCFEEYDEKDWYFSYRASY